MMNSAGPGREPRSIGKRSIKKRLVESCGSGALADQRQNRVDRRCRDLGETSHFLDYGDQRIDLHWTSALKILQHRGLVGADLARTFDPPLDVDAEFHPKR